MRGYIGRMSIIYIQFFCAFALIATICFVVLWLRKSQRDLQAVTLELERCKLTLEISEHVGRFGSWHMNSGTRVVRWSDYIFDMHERRHSLGHPPLENAIDYYHRADRLVAQSAVEKALKKGEDFEFRARIITEQGNEIPVLSRGTCQIDKDGSVLGVFGCFIDLSAPEDR